MAKVSRRSTEPLRRKGTHDLLQVTKQLFDFTTVQDGDRHLALCDPIGSESDKEGQARLRGTAVGAQVAGVESTEGLVDQMALVG